MIFILIGVALLILTFYLLWNRRKKELKMKRMLDANSLSLRDVQKRIANNHTLEDGIEVKGVAQCKSALVAPFSLNPVVYYKCQITRVFQKKILFTGQDGQQHEKWESDSDIVFEDENFTLFSINDGTAEVQIDLKGAEITPDISYQSTEKGELFTLSDRFDEHPELKNKLTLLRKEIEVSNEGKDVTGFEFIEYTLPMNKDLFVLGGVGVKKDLPILNKKSGVPFVVSIRTSQQVFQKLDDKLQRYFFMALVSGLVGAICIIYGIKGFL